MRHLIIFLLSALCFLVFSGCASETPITEQPTESANKLSSSDFATAKTLFDESNCQSCHSGYIAPDFNGHLPSFTKVENGKTHLINALLFGMQGPITVNGQTFDGQMNNRSNDFNDTEIALLLNYGLTAWDNSNLLSEDFTLITAAEVATERQTVKTDTEVYTARQALKLP